MVTQGRAHATLNPERAEEHFAQVPWPLGSVRNWRSDQVFSTSNRALERSGNVNITVMTYAWRHDGPNARREREGLRVPDIAPRPYRFVNLQTQAFSKLPLDRLRGLVMILASIVGVVNPGTSPAIP